MSIMKINTPIFAFFVLSSALVLRSAAISPNDLLGIAPEDEKYYVGLWSSGTIKCKDGSKTFTKSQLNDDFCDCFDGTDEPGTSACPSGKFYCRNAGHRPLTIFSSRVNDGICDCCDGSDEYDGKSRCKSTCWEAGKVARDRLMEKIELFKNGVSIRNNEIKQAKISLQEDKENLSKLKHEEKILKGVVHQLKDHKERIEREVEKECIQKEKEENQKKKVEESESSKEHKGEEKEPAKSNEDPAADVAQNAHASYDDVQQYAAKKEETSDLTHATDDIDSLSKEDLGREIGSRWTGKKTEHQNHDDETSVNVHNEENNGDNTETEDDHEHYEEDDHTDVQEDTHDDSSSSHDYDPDEYEDISDMETTSSPSLIEKIQQTVRNFLLAVNPFQTPVNTSEAESVRKEYDEANEKLSKMKTKISRLTKKLANDFGPEKEFYLLHGRCFETKQNKYVYRVCPFKQATQEEGYSTTRLGKWDKFVDSYSAMLFSNGDNCWNGPDRSLKVRLRCGLKIELHDIDEPSRCEYEAILTTPALCLEEKLKELEDELEFLNKDQLQLHDEL